MAGSLQRFRWFVKADAAYASVPRMRLRWKFLGVRPFQAMWDLQEQTRAEIIKGNADQSFLFLTQHPPTISLGRAEKGANILTDEASLKEQGFDVVHANRGGKVTYHGPGQLVAYPVVNLSSFGMGVKDFVCRLEKTMIHFLAKYDVTASRRDGYPGAWVGANKIGSVGIHVRKQVSNHGLAININPNLEHFNVIQACGISGIQMTSLAKEGIEKSVDEIVEPFVDSFSTVFKCEMEKSDRGD